ncbi:MAG: GNAT family N-acetyltransferase [Saprospiraceae bacterium]|nr:GNAT family N-acetyltransferase [Saprospiraceae bacterium]
MNLTFQCVPFHQLDVFQLYKIMALRQEVFVVEQNCPYLDADGKDLKGWHLTGLNSENQLIAYARLLPKGVSYPDYPSIGRIATSAKARGTGAGRALVQEALIECNRLFENEAVKIGAQLYLLKFYQSFGFESIGEEYLEDGIPHIEMIKPSLV